MESKICTKILAYIREYAAFAKDGRWKWEIIGIFRICFKIHAFVHHRYFRRCITITFLRDSDKNLSALKILMNANVMVKTNDAHDDGKKIRVIQSLLMETTMG